MATKERSAQAKANPLFSLASGTVAGAIEGFVTYPIEYTKTVAQFSTKAGAKVRSAPDTATAPPGDCEGDCGKERRNRLVQRVWRVGGRQRAQGGRALPLV